MARRRRRKVAEESTGPGAATGWVTLLVGLAVSGFLFWKNQQQMGWEEYYLLNTALVLGIPLVAVLVFLRSEASEWGMTPGDLRGGLLTALLLFALFVPVILVFSRTPAFQAYYVNQLTQSRAISFGELDAGRLLFHEIVLGFYMFGWEWFFRGFLLFGLRRLMPFVWAALVQAALFTLLHYGKPWPEVISSFFGALLLAAVAVRFRSFLPGFVLHWAISLSFDIAVLNNYLQGRAGR